MDLYRGGIIKQQWKLGCGALLEEVTVEYLARVISYPGPFCIPFFCFLSTKEYGQASDLVLSTWYSHDVYRKKQLWVGPSETMNQNPASLPPYIVCIGVLGHSQVKVSATLCTFLITKCEVIRKHVISLAVALSFSLYWDLPSLGDSQFSPLPRKSLKNA